MRRLMMLVPAVLLALLTLLGGSRWNAAAAVPGPAPAPASGALWPKAVSRYWVRA